METGEKQERRPGTFKPGQSGNLNGRPKKEWTWRSLLIEAAEEEDIDPVTQQKVPAKKIMAKKLVSKAKEGDVQALKEFADRIDGKAMQPTDITSGGEKLTGLTVTLTDASGD